MKYGQDPQYHAASSTKTYVDSERAILALTAEIERLDQRAHALRKSGERRAALEVAKLQKRLRNQLKHIRVQEARRLARMHRRPASASFSSSYAGAARTEELRWRNFFNNI